MRSIPWLACALLLGACAATTTSSAGLLDTYWRLTELDGKAAASPPGAREIHFVMHSENRRVAGFSGCNNLMGSYVLAGQTLKFEQMGGTLMACVSGMNAEQNFLAMFSRVVRWEISGETLSLLDANGKSVARFESRPLK